MLDSRKRLLGGAVISVVGLGTALLFRKSPEDPPRVAWPSGFTEVQPSAPLANPAPPEPVQPRLAGRIEALVEGPAPAAGSLYQLPGNLPTDTASSPAAPIDPFLRGNSFSSQAPANNNASNLNAAVDSAAASAKIYQLEELKPLPASNPPSSSTPVAFAEPAKLDPAQQAAASLASAAPVEHSAGYRWSPNRSSIVDPPGSTPLAERPSLLAPPPMTAMPGAVPNSAPAAGAPLPPAEPTPSLSLSDRGFAPAPLLSALPVNSSSVSGARHRIVDGDTLGSIARRYYGDEQRARELFEANRAVLRDPELLPIGTELQIPGGSNPTAFPAAAPPQSQAVPPLLTPPALEQFTPRTLAVSSSAWRGANEPPLTPAPSAAPLAPVALNPWDQQLAAAAPLGQQSKPAPFNAPNVVNSAPAPVGWPPAAVGAPASAFANSPASAPQVGWPPQPASAPANWPTRAWNSSENALNWVGDKILGTGSPAAPSATSKTYLVKPLETWETLAQRFYGDPRHATTLQSANQQVPAGSKIRPGTVINVPAMPL